jgi:hypothetical protein
LVDKKLAQIRLSIKKSPIWAYLHNNTILCILSSYIFLSLTLLFSVVSSISIRPRRQ